MVNVRELEVGADVRTLGLELSSTSPGEVTEVTESSWAAEQGIVPGDVLLSVNGCGVDGMQEDTLVNHMCARPLTLSWEAKCDNDKKIQQPSMLLPRPTPIQEEQLTKPLAVVGCPVKLEGPARSLEKEFSQQVGSMLEDKVQRLEEQLTQLTAIDFLSKCGNKTQTLEKQFAQQSAALSTLELEVWSTLGDKVQALEERLTEYTAIDLLSKMQTLERQFAQQSAALSSLEDKVQKLDEQCTRQHLVTTCEQGMLRETVGRLEEELAKQLAAVDVHVALKDKVLKLEQQLQQELAAVDVHVSLGDKVQKIGERLTKQIAAVEMQTALEEKVRNLEQQFTNQVAVVQVQAATENEVQELGEPLTKQEIEEHGQASKEEQSHYPLCCAEKCDALDKKLSVKIDRTFVEFTGFVGDKSSLNTRFYLDSARLLGDRETYWTAEGTFVLCFHGDDENASPWAIQYCSNFEARNRTALAVCSSKEFDEAEVWYTWGGTEFEFQRNVRATTSILPVTPRS